MVIQWQDGPPTGDIPEGDLLLILLKKETSQQFEHYDDPVIVRYWGYKLKTTIDPIRIELDDVLKWARLDRQWLFKYL